ncbi:methyltransferase domain-containing protein [Pseudoalteromonas mariniglutinosa]|uniref:methyltransferase domain-containing protein n=1 Tax=Pseudoalteromonas mariniglutinosa TaxID=206042 RepID=UPI00384E83D8
MIAEQLPVASVQQVKQFTANKFSKAALDYQTHASVQKRAAQDLLTYVNLSQVTHQGGVCLDLGAGPLVNTTSLGNYFDHVLAVDLSFDMLQSASLQCPKVCADMDRLPFIANSVDSVFSNFAVQWSTDLAGLFVALYRILKPAGKVYLSCVCEGSLNEIKQAFTAIDSQPHINNFYTSQQLNQFASQAGFTIATQRKQCYQDSYATPLAALRSLKAIGATSQHHQNKRKGLLTKHALQQVCNAYPLDNACAKVSYQVVLLELYKP